jgi:CelD/BcsL family acetyltransferase involved in cellulose biosynthesis
MTVEVRIAQNGDAEEWDTIISKSPHGTLFHSWDWLKIIEKHTSMKLYPLIGVNGSTSIGVFPLFFQKKGPLRMVFSPPPHAQLPYLGPALAGPDTIKHEKREDMYIEFQNSFEHFIINNLKAHYIRISLPPDLQDLRPFTWSGYSIHPEYDYVSDLSIGPDSLLQILGKKQRQNLNRAKKRGITVEIGGKQEYEAILDLIEIRYAHQGKNFPASRDYFLDIYTAFRENIIIFVAKVDNEIVTGSIDFHYKNTHYSWIGSPKPKNPISPSPNDLLIWESVRYAQERGCRYYVTVSAAGNQRLHVYYMEKLNPDLNIRYLVKKTSFLTGLIETGYQGIVEPIKGKILHVLKK